jgi:hypothetical protein
MQIADYALTTNSNSGDQVAHYKTEPMAGNIETGQDFGSNSNLS